MHLGNSILKGPAKTISTVAISCLLSFISAPASPAQSNVYTKWSASYGNPNLGRSTANVPSATVADGLGNAYVTGSVGVCFQSSANGCQAGGSESVVVKYDSHGQTIWRAFLAASPDTDPNWGGAQGTGLGIALDALGNVYVLSVLFVPDVETGPPTIATAKYSPDGTRQWVNYIASPYTESGGLQPSPVAPTRYFPTALAVSPAGDVYTSFYQVSNTSQGQTALVVKYASNGNQQWMKTVSPTPYDTNTPEAIQLDSNENVYVLVFSSNSSNSKMNASEIFKLNSGGSLLASFGADKLGFPMPAAAYVSLPGTYSTPVSVSFHVDAQGNSYVAGGGAPTSPGSGEIYGVEPRIVAKFNSSGSLDWLYTFGPPNHLDGGDVGITALAVDSAGDVLVAQTTDLKGANPPGSQGTDISVNKFDPSGNLLWSSNYNGHSDGSGFDQVVAIASDPAGSSYVTGVSTSTQPSVEGTFTVLATIKYDSAGNQVWAERHQSNVNASDGPPTALAVSGSDVFVTGLGVSSSQSTAQEWLTVSYGQDAAEANPAIVNFGNQTEGTQSAPQTVTLTNISNAPLTFTTINYTGDFRFTNNCPDTLVAGESCLLFVTFTPSATGALTGTITVRDTSPGNAISPETFQLAGTGTN
jgi:hypothetical protein